MTYLTDTEPDLALGLALNRAGQVVVTLKTPYREGTTHIVMSPLEFIQRLAALVPRPRLHLIRFHGVLGPNATLRPDIIPNVPVNVNTPSADHAEVPPSRGACPHELGPAAHKTAGSGFERRMPARRAKARRAFVNECSRSTSSTAPSAVAP